MNNIGLMYLFNPENGNLVNTQTGKDIEIISWEDLVKDIKKIIIGIDGRLVYAPAAENAIIPFQEWLAKEHPEVELSLHSGPVRGVMILDENVIVVEAHTYGMSVVTARALHGKLGKMAKFNRIGEGEDEITIHVDKTRKESPFSSKAMNIPLGQSVEMSEEDKNKVIDGIRKTNELLKSGHPLINQHFTAGISPGRFYMMGSHTDPSKSKLITADDLNLALNKAIAFNGRQMKVYVAFGNHASHEENQNAAKEMAGKIDHIAGANWIGVAHELDADLGLNFTGKWWEITKARGCEGITGKYVIFKQDMMETAKGINVEDAYPKVDNAQLPKRGQMNAYDVDWEEASQGILIILDVQKHMSSADSELNGQMLRRVTDAILSKNLNANITIKGDTDCDYETRLVQEFTNAHCVINIAGGEAEIEKFRMFPDLVGVELW